MVENDDVLHELVDEIDENDDVDVTDEIDEVVTHLAEDDELDEMLYDEIIHYEYLLEIIIIIV